MGAYLSQPVTAKDSHDGVGADFVFGGSCMQGWRKSMEDAEILLPELSPEHQDTAMFAVFDGHGGTEVSKFCQKYMPGELAKIEQFKNGELGAGLANAFHRMDEMIDDEKFDHELNVMRMGEDERDMSISGLPGGVAGKEDGEEVSSSPGAGGSGGGAGGAARGKSDAVRMQEMQDPMSMLKEFLASRKQQGADMRQQAGQPPVASRDGVCMLPDHRIAAGCTAVVCLKRGSQVVVANAGDSRAVLCRGGEAVALSYDHKPNQEREHNRIRKAGGFVRDANGHHRVNGNLNLSRAIGDLKYKADKRIPREEQIITAEPDIIEETLTAADEFIVLCCDGVWDVMSNQEVCDFVSARLTEYGGKDGARSKEEKASICKKICEDLVDDCIADDPRQTQGIGGDNMSAVVVLLQQ